MADDLFSGQEALFRSPVPKLEKNRAAGWLRNTASTLWC